MRVKQNPKRYVFWATLLNTLLKKKVNRADTQSARETESSGASSERPQVEKNWREKQGEQIKVVETNQVLKTKKGGEWSRTEMTRNSQLKHQTQSSVYLNTF